MPQIRRVLEWAELPLDGLDDERVTLFIIQRNGRLQAVVGYEDYAPYTLIRSLAVSLECRRQGHGRRLLHFVLGEVARQGFDEAYGLTTSIPLWLGRLGFCEIARGDVPVALLASAEFQGACPDSAGVFRIARAQLASHA